MGTTLQRIHAREKSFCLNKYTREKVGPAGEGERRNQREGPVAGERSRGSRGERHTAATASMDFSREMTADGSTHGELEDFT
jgi:hypothetical protein